MRGSFDKQLEALHDELIRMGALCETGIANASKTLSDGGGAYVEKTKRIEEEIDEKEREIEALCLKILIQQQPVAKDLRQVSSALKMITDMERIGDQAADIAEISVYIDPGVKRSAYSLEEMARVTISMVTASIDSFINQDLEMARAVIARDDEVDNLFLTARDEIAAMIAADPSQGAYGLDLMMTAKYFERIGDHATNIAEWVIFALTGIHVGDDGN